ncbi:hypothetical protein D8674_011849 [Pyrus ussuriensis x Pyrus communis]|uniref:DUF1985 domain-containing protein n=1 Tax=Pyrus ussuriensis x Pyrus communis TaxID=2448454 RepID=A0A5N5G4J3_9ROSA|nr:hypothetical protein D8674_011849 [Pyrus ussuriensis x Pyrus communis]
MSKKILVTFVKLERAFKECGNEDDALQMGLVYFAETVLIRAKSNVAVNLGYSHLVEVIDRFNNYSWGAISFEQLQDSLSFAASMRGKGRVDGECGAR